MRRAVSILVMLSVLMSCNKDSRQDWGGMEHFDFEISGKVTDQKGYPINGIKVSASGSSVSTDSDGNYLLEGSGGADVSVVVSYSDVDGPENGGQYTSVSITVEPEYLRGSHGPYLGLFTKANVDIKMSAGLTPMPDTDIPLQ